MWMFILLNMEILTCLCYFHTALIFPCGLVTLSGLTLTISSLWGILHQFECWHILPNSDVHHGHLKQGVLDAFVIFWWPLEKVVRWFPFFIFFNLNLFIKLVAKPLFRVLMFDWSSLFKKLVYSYPQCMSIVPHKKLVCPYS